MVSALESGWGMSVISIGYRPVGWGSHHWEVTDSGGSRWFVTADELDRRQMWAAEPLDSSFLRLRAALATACALRDRGGAFVVAPVRSGRGEPLVRLGQRFGVAVYPFVDGESFTWGDFPPQRRRPVLEMVVGAHTAPASVTGNALADDFGVAYRKNLEAACGTGLAAGGPHARPVSALVQRREPAIRALLARYDRLVARARPGRAVLTHGEIHPGNTMLTAGGWRLIDWDTALVAPPERDLWNLDPGDGSVLGAYAEATGVVPQPSLLDLYRLRWDISDLAVGVARFCRPHAGDANDRKAWEELRSLIERVTR